MAIPALLNRGIVGTGWRRALVSLAMAVAVYFMNQVYDLLNHGPAIMHLQTAFDRALPLAPIFIIPYDSLNLYVYVSLVAFLVFRTKVFQSAAASMLLAWLVSYFFYYFFQTEVSRPVITAPGALNDMIRTVYATDNPFNDFPSLHTSISTILAIHWFRVDRRIGWPVAIWTALIVASTLLVKQHYVADLLSGLVLAASVSVLWGRVILRGEVRESSERSR
ncbi:MAG TPA: phosphatase PAP2 family protein [Rectinemataceae bacterium]|nr:phosphatase PAP2 family protein [Rectinemataceae bacterium]